ncbi:hypothetical protein KZ779_03410 [Escherichia coli]|nr:hypothetical protein [Escherichia coli]
MSNLLTVHQNLPALPVDATSDEVRKNLMDMFRDRRAFSEHTRENASVRLPVVGGMVQVE